VGGNKKVREKVLKVTKVKKVQKVHLQYVHYVQYLLYLQIGTSFPSALNTSVIGASKAFAILKARSTEGFVCPFSILIIVCLLTPTLTASSS
jgi:hypothetical protein